MAYIIEIYNKRGNKVTTASLDSVLGVEEWRDIKGYEGIYQISDTGVVRSLKNGNYVFGYPNEKGYIKIDLCKNGVKTHHKAHRLVAQAFLPNPNNLPQVNHIDGNKKNNSVSNLEWCDNTENMLHAYRIGLKKHSPHYAN